MLVLIGNCWSPLSRLKSLNNSSVSNKMIPNFRLKLSDLYALSQSKLLENHTPSQWHIQHTWQYPAPSPSGNMYFCMRDTYCQNTAVVHKYHQCYKMIRTCTVNHHCYLLLKSVLIGFLSQEIFLRGFNRRCSYEPGRFLFFFFFFQILCRAFSYVAALMI